MSQAPDAATLDDGARLLAPALFNRTWELLDLETRTATEEEEMLAAAFAQRQLWYQVGTPQNRAIADWQVARVAALLGLPEIADRYARRSLESCEQHDLAAFYRGYAHEAIARAADVIGDAKTRDQHILAARELLGQVADTEERHMLGSDLELIVGPERPAE